MKPATVTLKAITLHQPWASLVAMSRKRFETRGWSTNVRGVVAIHAAAVRSTPLRHVDAGLALELGDGYDESRPLGAVVAIGYLESIHAVEDIRGRLTLEELRRGDYSDGRFAWRFGVVAPLDEPVPAKGLQRWWNWTPSPRDQRRVRRGVMAVLEVETLRSHCPHFARRGEPAAALADIRRTWLEWQAQGLVEASDMPKLEVRRG